MKKKLKRPVNDVNRRVMDDAFTVEHFANPSADHRPAPLWVWNDELTPRRVRQQLREFHRVGMGGAFVHPRPGLISEYLGPDWWKCWTAALDEAKKLGLKLQIYDENSYPSGFAGGHVPSQLPHAVASGVGMRKLKADEPSPEINLLTNCNVFASAEWHGEKYVFEGTKGETTHWLGGFAYVNLLRRDVTDKFLEVTHAEYFKRFGMEFGHTITAAFYDEPMIGNGAVYGGPLTLPFSWEFVTQFCERKGYDIIPEVPKLFLNMPGYQKVRFDYYETLHQLFVENFARPMQEWCRKHHVAVTGHYMEHTWLNPCEAGTPDAMAMYEWMDMPGIDMLECRIGREGVQTSIGHTPSLLLMTIRELLSAANQLGHKRTLCETYGAGGYDSTFEDYKRLGDWLYVHGVNYQNQHLSFMTIRGARKRDHPQTFSEHAVWWPHYKSLNDYFGRLSLVLSQGHMHQRVLLVHPTTSGWVEANLISPSEKIKLLYDAHSNLVQYLCDRFWDFDLGDEFILENHGKVAGGALQVGRQRYEVVVMPAHTLNLRSATVLLLEKFTQNGGRIFLLGDPPKMVDGKPSDRVAKLAEKWIRVTDHAKLDRDLDQAISRQVRVSDTADWPGHLAVMRRELDQKTVAYFFTNMSGRRVRLRVAVTECGRIEQWNALTGEVKDDTLDLDLAHGGSTLYLVHIGRKPAAAPVGRRPAAVGNRARKLELTGIRRHDLNVLALDYCDVHFADRTLRGVYHWHANKMISLAHGFERPAWDNAVQFKRTLLDRDHFPKNSGFAAQFHFEVGHRPARLELAIECPELYRVLVNNKRVSFADGKRWLDAHLGVADISRLAQTGANTVMIVGRPYRVRMELEPIYLRGDFRLEPVEKGFRIGASKALALGAWRAQGHPFYSDRVVYEFRFRAGQETSRRVLCLPKWGGTLAAVTVNGVSAGIIGWPSSLTGDGGYELEITRRVRAGENRLYMTVYGTLKNLLGPFHCHEMPRGYAWPSTWHMSPQRGPPPGGKYDVLDYGLFEMPEVVVF